MSEERIAAIRAREQAATRGPWKAIVYRKEEPQHGFAYVRYGPNPDDPYTSCPEEIADARFIAKAREDVPYLLTELENQAEVIRHLQDAALTLREMRDEARAAALEEAAKIADPIEPECQCDRCLALRMIAKRIREALAPPQAEEP